MEDPTGKLGDLIISQSQSEIRCVDKIAFSSFNPVPGYRRYGPQYIRIPLIAIEVIESKTVL
jgi:hypothetical protein